MQGARYPNSTSTAAGSKDSMRALCSTMSAHCGSRPCSASPHKNTHNTRWVLKLGIRSTFSRQGSLMTMQEKFSAVSDSECSSGVMWCANGSVSSHNWVHALSTRLNPIGGSNQDQGAAPGAPSTVPGVWRRHTPPQITPVWAQHTQVLQLPQGGQQLIVHRALPDDVQLLQLNWHTAPVQSGASTWLSNPTSSSSSFKRLGGSWRIWWARATAPCLLHDCLPSWLGTHCVVCERRGAWERVSIEGGKLQGDATG